VNVHLILLIAYSIAVVAFGLWTARFIRHSADFFVAGRSLGPGLILASMLAANIGAGSTVGVAGLAYRDGISAWWWVGAAGLGSLVLAFWVGPALWRLAKAKGFYTTGDFMEYRYGSSVRAITAFITCVGALAILAGQLIAGAAILNVVVGVPTWAGSLIGSAIMTIYFTAGGLLGTAWVNSLQLVIMLVGFLIALPVALNSVGGVAALTASPAPPWFDDFFYSAGPGSGWTLLFLTFPAFIISPGLIQKSFGAASDRVLTRGVAWNAIALLLFAFVPTLFGMIARVSHPGIANANLVLPTVLLEQLPAWLGALALAAVFSTEVDTCDAVLFMISTTLSQDVYKRHVNPKVSDRQLLFVARVSAVTAGAAGTVLSIYLGTVTQALIIFYALLGVTFFVPVLGGLLTTRAGTPEALAAIVSGVTTLLIVAFALPGRAAWLDPTMSGIVIAALAFTGVMLFRRSSSHVRPVQAG
jgi:solute:Na+ symporter, SSS family